MAHVGQELALGDVGRLGLDGHLVGPLVGLLQFFKQALHLILGSFLLADIAQDAHGIPAALDLDRGQRKGNGDFPAVFVQPRQFKGLADGRSPPRAQKLREGVVVGSMIAFGSDQVMQVAADHIRAGMAENPLGGGVPKGQPALVVHHQDGILGGSGDGPQIRLAIQKLLRRLGLIFKILYLLPPPEQGQARPYTQKQNGYQNDDHAQTFGQRREHLRPVHFGHQKPGRIGNGAYDRHHRHAAVVLAFHNAFPSL